MATKKSQRWGILIIMIAMIVGTLGSFAAMILSQNSQSAAAAAYQKATAAYTKEQQAYQAQVDAQSDELSAQYFDTFKQYLAQVSSFDIDSVKSLTTEDLAAGSGEEITGTTKFAVYYLGWDANGTKFQGGNSFDSTETKLAAPFAISDGLDQASLIDGWKEGLVGMHIGGVRLLTIPSDKAYKEAGSKDSSGTEVIAPNMPLKFVVMAIPTPEAITPSAAYTKATNDYYAAMSEYYGTN